MKNQDRRPRETLAEEAGPNPLGALIPVLWVLIVLLALFAGCLAATDDRDENVPPVPSESKR